MIRGKRFDNQSTGIWYWEHRDLTKRVLKFSMKMLPAFKYGLKMKNGSMPEYLHVDAYHLGWTCI